MLGDNQLFVQKPNLTISPDGKFIEVIGHYGNVAECAKLTLLCEQYGAVVLKDGYAKVPYDTQFLYDVEKYVNPKTHFVGLSAGAIALLMGILASGAATAGGASAGANYSEHNRNNALKQQLIDQYGLTEAQAQALVAQYGDKEFRLFDSSTWGNQTDYAGIAKLMQEIQDAYAKYGYAPEAPTESDLARIQQEAYDEIDAENQRILDLYNQTFQNSENVLNRELINNAQMFGDYRNQLLTNEAMRQQAIAGSTRFELDRQQRNAITRGASAAQRLVANINTQLGLQAQSAQQALDTSNALAQNLLAHRQAQQGVRNAYLQAQNQYNQNVASNLSGQAERRYNYGQGRKQGAIEDYNYAYDNWNENITNALGPTGAGIYRSKYGSGRNSNQGI